MSLAAKLQLKEPGVRVLNAPSGVALENVAPIAEGAAVLLFAEKAADLAKHGEPP